MKFSFKPFILNTVIAIATVFSSCQKENLLSTIDATAIQTAIAQTQAIAVAASTATSGDSIYIVNKCPQNGHRDTIAFSSLPALVTNYLSANYSGYTFLKAFSIKDAAGVLQGSVVVIQFNGNPVGLKFDASGVFVQVLEQREGKDLLGHGYHDGGCFEHRDGKQRDTIALSSLPANIQTYFSANYAADTLVRASKTWEGGYIVLSKNNGLFATLFNASGIFVSRVTLPAPQGKENSIDQNALPASVLSYLSTTYPGFVFDKAFSITVNGIVQGYCVIIDANNTKYGLQFDATGKFVNVKTIR